MVFSISPTASLLLHSSSTLSTGRKILSFSYPRNSSISIPKTAIFRRGVPQLGLSPFAPWNGLKLVFRCQVNRGRKGNQKGRRGVYASLFGIGAPEVLVIGVVALLVFGPKGLAEVARNLGKTVRAFQPTIRELQEVSREFKSTLQREIGIDDVNSPISSSTSMYNGNNAVASDSETTSKTDSSSSENYDAAAVNVKTDQVLQSHSQLQKQQEDEAGSLQIQSSSDADENSKSESPSKEAAAAVTTTPPTNP